MQLMTFKACGGTSILLHYQSCYLSLRPENIIIVLHLLNFQWQ